MKPKQINYSEVYKMQKFYDLAKKFEGMHEKYDNKDLKKFLKVDPAQIPWCAYFINSLLEYHGVKSTESGLARSYLKFGKNVKLRDIQQGDIVVFKRGNSSWQGHVGLFSSRTAKGMYVLGGNQSNKVCIKWHPLSKLIGIRRV